MMTREELETVQNIIDRLKAPDCGCGGMGINRARKILVETEIESQMYGTKIELVSRTYLDTWVIPALEMLLPGERRNTKLAVKLSRR